MAHQRIDPIWTPTFTLLCAAQFFGYAQHSMLAPALPLYVSYLGGSPFIVGVVLASFAVTSVLIRPLIGHWADHWSEAGVLVCGLLFQGTVIFLCFIPLVEAAMLANGLRGIGWAGLNTGGYSLLALTAPESRRGEASGFYSGVQSAVTILFPAVALWLIHASFGGFRVVFAVTGALSFLGAIAGMVMARTVPRGMRSPQPAAPTSWWRELFHFVEHEVFLPTLLLLWLNLSLPSMTNFIFLYARQLGLENFGVYFIVNGATSLLARPLLGRVSDHIGRARSVVAGFVLQVIALMLIAAVSSLSAVVLCGALYMVGNAIGSSTILALAVERADPRRRGKAMATFSVAYPLSYGLGSLFAGGAVEIAGYVGMFLILAALEAAGFLFGIAKAQKIDSPPV